MRYFRIFLCGLPIWALLFRPALADVGGSTPNARAQPSAAPAAAALVWEGPKAVSAQTDKDKVLLAWEPLEAPERNPLTYQVLRSERAGPGQPWTDPVVINRAKITDTYFLDTNGSSTAPPVEGREYAYRIVALDPTGNSSTPSQPVSVKAVPQLCPPMGLEAHGDDRQVTLNWLPPFSNGTNGLAGYQIFRALSETDAGVPVSAALLSGTQFSDRGQDDEPLQNGQTYYYYIVAQGNDGTRSAASERVPAVPRVHPGAPPSFTADGKTDDAIELNWGAATDGTFPIAGYNIYRGLTAETLEGPINKSRVTQTTYLDSAENSLSQPVLGRTYHYVVKAVDQTGFEGPPSAAASAVTKAPVEIPQTGILSASIPGLPPESSLTISGRKRIDLGYTEIVALNNKPGDPTERSLSSASALKKGFNLEQELQVKLQGKVGKKITVDVDYDDRTEEQRKISIVYAGDPNEVIQEAAFGDIKLDLPRTEFAGYNKELFGAKLKVGLDRFRFTAIGAQTKGITVTETFKGNASLRTVDISDTNFDAFRYYFLTKDPAQVNHPDLPNHDPAQPTHGLVPGTVRIFMTDGRSTSDTIRVNRVEPTGNTRTLAFNLLNSGVDYTVDFERGIVTFTNSVSSAAIMAVAYAYSDAAGNTISVGYAPDGTFDFTPQNLTVPVDGFTRDTAHLIQDTNSFGVQTNYIMMIMNRYALGAQNILNPQTDRDFVIKLFRTSGEEIPLPQPSDPLQSERFYTIDPTFGLIKFRNHYPFQGSSATENPSPLTPNNTFDPFRVDPYNPLHNSRLGLSTSTDGNNYRIRVEFKSQISTFQLAHFNVIQNSEVIKRDGAKLKRDTDYYIDFDTGFITFLNPEAIASSTQITISYEYMPFGGKFQSNLFGARGEYDLIEGGKLSIGSTFLYNSSQAPQDVPDVGSTPTSLSLIDGDAKLSLNPDDFSMLAEPFFGPARIPVSLDVSAEGAYSTYEINTYRKAGENGVAMIDNMDGSDNVLSLPLDNNTWFPGSVPVHFQNDSPATRQFNALTVVNELVSDPVDGNDKANQLRWNYADMTNTRWESFIYPLSTSGSNLHEYRYLEISVFNSTGQTSPVNLFLDLGLVSEDSNGNNRLNFEGDRITLSPGTDTGIGNYLDPDQVDAQGQPVVFTDPDGPRGTYAAGAPAGYWGENNNRLNSEDLDRNDRLDTAQSYYEYKINDPLRETPVLLRPGWNTVKIPLAKYTARRGDILPTEDTQSPQFLSFIKHARIWITGAGSAPVSGYLQFEKIQLTGNKWQTQVAVNAKDAAGNLITEPDPGKIIATTVSRNTDLGYVPNPNFYLYDKNNEELELKNERALELEYNLNRQDIVDPQINTESAKAAFYITRTLSTTGVDYSGYRYLRVDLYKPRPTDLGEILFIRLGIDKNNYFQYHLSLDGVPVGSWTTLTMTLDGSDQNRIAEFQRGIIPSLNQVREISLGIINPNSTSRAEKLQINNIRVTDGQARMGAAFRVTSNTKISDLLTIGSDYRDVDSDFLSIDETPSGKQHVTNSSVNAAITKLPFLPVRAQWVRSSTFTDAEHRDNPAYTQSYAAPDVTQETVSGEIAYTQLPGLDLAVRAQRFEKGTEYIGQRVNVNNLEQNASLNPTLSYTLPDRIFNFPIGSTTFSGNLTYRNTKYTYDPEGRSLLARADYYDRWLDSIEERYSYTGNYQPVSFLNLSPGFTYSTSRERGFLSLYRFYADLNPTFNPGNPKYFSGLYRTSRADQIAKLDLSLTTLPVISPSISYNNTVTRDYVSDSLLMPGWTLNFRSGFNPGELFGWASFPRFNLARNYKVNASFQTDINKDPISRLALEDLWWVDPLNFENQDRNTPFNQAHINSKSLTDSVTSNISLMSDLSLTPSYGYSWTRSMTQGNFTTAKTLSLGSGLNWSRVWLLEGLLNLQSINLDYQYRLNQNYDSFEIENSRVTSYQSALNLPFTLLNELTSNLTFGYSGSKNQSGNKLDIILFQNQYTFGLSNAYLLRLLQPIRLPDFWPFNGSLIRLEQALRLVNTFNLDLIRNTEQGTKGQESIAETYTNETTVDYSLWRNVQGNVRLVNQWYFNHSLPNRDYYAISLSLGLTATF